MVSFKRVGGLRFVRIGRLNISYSVSKPAPRAPRAADGSGIGDALAVLPLLAAALAAFLA